MKSYKKIVVLSALTAAFVVGSGAAFANDSSEPKDWSVTLGLKAWANEWQSWETPAGVWLGGSTFGTANATSLNPSLTVKYKDFFVSGGVMNKTNYSISNTAGGAATPASRKESDLSVGYYVLPQVALTLGYKQITQTWGTQTWVWRIPAVGISAASAIQDTKMFMYGNAAIGKSSISTSGVDTAPQYSGGTYTTAEFGLGYSLTQSFRLTGGYKFQSSPTSMNPYFAGGRVTMVDTTRGFVLGGSYTF